MSDFEKYAYIFIAIIFVLAPVGNIISIELDAYFKKRDSINFWEKM